MMSAMVPRALPALIALALSLSVAACAGAGEAGSSPTTPPASVSAVSPSPEESHGPHESGPEVEAYLALCRMQALIAQESLVAAETTFHDEVHETLHELADRVEDVDRGVAATLLMAKARVEEDLASDPTSPGILAEDVAALLEAMEATLDALAIPAPGCPEQPQ
jgi:hypothetical protein